MKKTNDHKKALTAFTLVALLALMALIFPYREESATGMIGGGQTLRSTPYSQLYTEQKTGLYTLVTTDHPCKAVHCQRVKEAHPEFDPWGNVLTDEYGNVWCICDGLGEVYHRVSPTRKY